ncbi:DNA phosphorothioation-dependent restriction protein DptG [Pseudoalteromonas sp. B530]|uniref:DNA phosphorothioation-dependent restriction protein DptG n=1 Tax=Pseudoalteromonas sp. B530 TaxID=2994390 RepID=UPI00224B1077|nr:DNA phosphorothioation-dependent restriction protein DptG [Pseudoalteromonas sp. B530]MCX2767113.1 DNA phosphorothioation-dependent restriction protein DptG [Pseudoalteromonas sp. B530]
MNEHLIQSKNRVSSNYKNNAARYLPIGPSLPTAQNLNWNVVYKNICQNLFLLECNIQTRKEFYENILRDIKENRHTKDLATIIEKVYFENTESFEITPYSRLINSDKVHARTKTMVDVFDAMLCGLTTESVDFIGNNFLEEIVNNTAKQLCTEIVKVKSKTPYLPFLAKKCQEDFSFISARPELLNESMEHLIEIYAFLYITQLSLHLYSPKLRFSEPTSQEMYFILEGEKASKERHFTFLKGYKRVFEKDVGASYDIFPHLGYLELIATEPLWVVSLQAHEQVFIDQINELNSSFCNEFNIHFAGNRTSFEDAINDGLTYHKEIFKENNKKSERYRANQMVCTAATTNFASNFKVNKGRAGGWYFQLSTKTVLLLTNLIIGDKKKLLIDDVVEGFNERGIYFDLKSKQALLAIYENIGNVIKLSDSGDAVYVTSTI